MICGFPFPQTSPPSLIRWCPLGSVSTVGAGTRLLVLATLCVLNAAELVTTLNDDPGGYVSEMARLSSGCPGALISALSIWLNLVPLKVVSTFGLKVGYDARARTRPLVGSSATTAAGWPPSARSAWYAAS